jgi:methanogenic corrinoid protein MtbC1
MVSGTLVPDPHRSIVEAIIHADRDTALAASEHAIARGDSPVDLLRQIGVAQREVGARWERGQMTVADEHAATAVADHVLTILSAVTPAESAGDEVVFACAENEWHTMPARLAAETARARGLRVRMLGGSIPADHLHRYLSATKPVALALSATLPTNLVGAAMSIEAAHRAGVPVIVGGAAWGTTQHRARTLGADLQLGDPADLPRAVRRLARDWTRPSRPARPPEVFELAEAPKHVAELAWERHCAQDPYMSALPPVAAAHAIDDLRWLMRYTAAALICDDPTILIDVLAWLVGYLKGRGVTARNITDGCHHLADTLAATCPGASEMIQRCAHGLVHGS